MAERRIGRAGRPMNPAPAFVAVVALVFVLFVLVALTGAFKKTPRDQIGLSYGGGPVEGQRFQRVVQPGHALFFNGMFDKLYLYPVTQRNYIISKRPSEGDVGGADYIRAPSHDKIGVDYEVAV